MIDLLQGDCLDLMKQIKDNSIDCIICDLPYGTTACKWDSIIDLDELWLGYNRICRDGANIILFASGEFTFKLYNSNSKQYKYKLIWNKNVPTGMNQAKYRPMKYYEEILVFQKGTTKENVIYNPQMKERVGERKACYRFDHYCAGNTHIANNIEKQKKRYDKDFVQPSDVLTFNVVPNATKIKKLHPTQKPLDLIEWLVKTYSNENSLILDNCMGSGTTGLACKNLGRHFIGIEKEQKYFEIAKARIQNG